MFVDCLYVSIRTEFETKKHAVYCIVAYDLDGRKDILGLWVDESKNKHQWMQIFDELKHRGVEDVAFISMDGLPGLEDGAKTIFPKAVIQRCIVHLVRNSMKYIPAKNYKEFTANLKLIYKAPNKKVALLEFEKFKERWSEYPGAIKIWESNWQADSQYSPCICRIRTRHDRGTHTGGATPLWSLWWPSKKTQTGTTGACNASPRDQFLQTGLHHDWNFGQHPIPH